MVPSPPLIAMHGQLLCKGGGLFCMIKGAVQRSSLPNCILVPHPVKALSHTLRPTHDQFAGQIQRLLGKISGTVVSKICKPPPPLHRHTRGTKTDGFTR